MDLEGHVKCGNASEGQKVGFVRFQDYLNGTDLADNQMILLDLEQVLVLNEGYEGQLNSVTRLESFKQLPAASKWVLVDKYTDASKAILQKLSYSSRLNIYIDHINIPVLSVLLNKYEDLLFSDISLIKPTKKLINQLYELNGFNNYIINPLNPLKDDLDFQVYDSFRKDRNKYFRYQEAIELAVGDLKLKYNRPLQILIIGPGLGDLVDITLQYYPRATVVEKNRKLIDHLTCLNQEKWNNAADLIFGDVREISSGKFDLIISEMLGSFGCNELFPEILNGLEAEIMIPSHIESKITPIYCPYTSEQPFLNNVTNYYQLCEGQIIWDWQYPGESELTKYSKIDMIMEVSGIINGIMGEFRANLYGDYMITNEKDYINLRAEKYCKSWFPMIFPIKGIDVGKADRINIEFARNSTFSRNTFSRNRNELNNTTDNVWYTWTVNGLKYVQTIEM